jgi:hypothetical protein
MGSSLAGPEACGRTTVVTVRWHPLLLEDVGAGRQSGRLGSLAARAIRAPAGFLFACLGRAVHNGVGLRGGEVESAVEERGLAVHVNEESARAA